MPTIEDRIRSGGATLAFDTNAIIGFSRTDRRITFGAFWTVCDDVNRLRGEAWEPLDLSVVVPALAAMEVLHDLRTSRSEQGLSFDHAVVRQNLETKKAMLAPFHDDAAMRASEVLHRWFPEAEAWRIAKRARCLEVLGLPDAPGGAGLASIDWAIAAQAETEGWILVTADTRAEFDRVSSKIRRSDLRRILDTLLRERGLLDGSPAR